VPQQLLERQAPVLEEQRDGARRQRRPPHEKRPERLVLDGRREQPVVCSGGRDPDARLQVIVLDGPLRRHKPYQRAARRSGALPPTTALAATLAAALATATAAALAIRGSGSGRRCEPSHDDERSLGHRIECLKIAQHLPPVARLENDNLDQCSGRQPTLLRGFRVPGRAESGLLQQRLVSEIEVD